MPHQCVRCGKMYEEGSSHIISGCTCGAKLFYFIRKEILDDVKKDRSLKILSADARAQIEQDIYDIIGDEVDRNLPVVLDIESVKVLRDGSFELDLVNLFNSKQPLVYRLEEGKYVIDIANSFTRTRKPIKKKTK
ncbi:MAG TPA: Zn-ribbon containing protein [Acidobacteriota bacterium]|nr:Zn-ribbon containing protein [Acidobacteriota bacterium]